MMSYYLEVPNFSQRFINVNIPAPTDSGGYNFEIEFECQATSTDLILNGTNSAASTDICFLKSSVLEYRRSGNTNISMTHGVTISDWHVYRLVFTGSGQGNIAFYVDGVFKANYTPSSSIATPAFTALLHLSSATRVGNFRYFKFTDFNNAANNRMYDARAYTSGDTVLQETANNVDGTFSAEWTALPPNFVADAAAGHNITITETLPALSDSMSMTFTPTAGTITISDWANNTGTALPSITDITVNVRSLVDGSTVYRTTTASTDVNADCVVSDAAIVSGTQYEVTALKFNGVDYDIGIAIITAT